MNDQEENAGAETSAALEARLAAVKAKRGYLLPHHGLLALAFPRLLEGYDAAYTAMALEQTRLWRRITSPNSAPPAGMMR
jgi:hypothetical protein